MQGSSAPAKLMALSGFVLKFLRRCWTALLGFIRPTQAEETELHDDADVLSRFIMQERHYRKSALDDVKGGARPEAFMPPPDQKLSTFLTTGVIAAEIWSIGRSVLQTGSRSTMYGRADLSVAVIRENGLRAMRDDHPERHVNVTGWPTLTDKDAEKSAIKSVAQELAAQAILRLLSPPFSR